MIRKLVAGSLLCIASSMAFADALPYVGVDVGYTTGNWKLKDPLSVNHNYSDTGIMGGVFAGFGAPMSRYVYFGIEGFYDASAVNAANQTINLSGGGTTSAKMNIKYSYGAGFIPGFLFNDQAMAYLRLGFIESQFSLKQTTPPTGSTSSSSNSMVMGGQYGVGVQGFVTRNVTIRGEYDYAMYRSFKLFGNKISARDNQFRIGIGYQFS